MNITLEIQFLNKLKKSRKSISSIRKKRLYRQNKMECSCCFNIYDLTLCYIHHGTCKECQKNRRKKYYKNNKSTEIKRVSKYNKTRKGKKYMKDYQKYIYSTVEGRKKRNEYMKSRYATNIIYNLSMRLRDRFRQSIRAKKWNKNNSIMNYLGCSLEDVKKHLEKQFQPGMSWDNRAKWHIDHIIPLSSAKTEEDLYKLCHYTNLQPLWAIDNLRKHAKIT